MRYDDVEMDDLPDERLKEIRDNPNIHVDHRMTAHGKLKERRADRKTNWALIFGCVGALTGICALWLGLIAIAISVFIGTGLYLTIYHWLVH